MIIYKVVEERIMFLLRVAGLDFISITQNSSVMENPAITLSKLDSWASEMEGTFEIPLCNSPLLTSKQNEARRGRVASPSLHIWLVEEPGWTQSVN